MKNRKIFNDPVHGFITIPEDVIFELINDPFFQRLNRIRQTGLTYLVYPGSIHTRFHHALGAMHLMDEAINILKQKDVKISDSEKTASLIAILLHDIGHGPFSHALENSIIHGVSHEELSLKFMKILREKSPLDFDLAINIFQKKHNKKFLTQLISSQLDVDRMDYLMRDSYFTGVSEGIIGTNRILKMMTVNSGELAIEEKGIYSIEKFIMARRLMYWQVYYHKTVLSAELMLTNILKRAHELSLLGENLFASPSLSFFLKNEISQNNLDENAMQYFTLLDDSDILSAIKVWQNHKDVVLRELSKSLINRHLFRTFLSSTVDYKLNIDDIKKQIQSKLKISDYESSYFIGFGQIKNETYNDEVDKIWISFKDQKKLDITEASDQLDSHTLSKKVVKNYVSYPKWVNIDI